MAVTRTRPCAAVAGVATSLLFMALPPATAQASTAPAAFVPGDVLVGNFGGNVEQYAADGTPKQTFTTGGSMYEGASLTAVANGLLATAYVTGTAGTPIGNVALFRPDGTLATTFVTPGLAYPGDVSTFPDGTLAVVDRFSSNVDLFTQAGAAVRTVTATGLAHPFGSAVAPDGTLWVTDPQDDALFHLTEAGGLLGRVSLAYAPGDVVVSPADASLYVTDNNGNVLHHLTAAGVQVGSFATLVGATQENFRGVGLAPDGTLYATGFTSTVAYHYSPSGGLLGSFPLQYPGGSIFISVVPAAVPEPATVSVLVVAATDLLRRRRGVPKC